MYTFRTEFVSTLAILPGPMSMKKKFFPISLAFHLIAYSIFFIFNNSSKMTQNDSLKTQNSINLTFKNPQPIAILPRNQVKTQIRNYKINNLIQKKTSKLVKSITLPKKNLILSDNSLKAGFNMPFVNFDDQSEEEANHEETKSNTNINEINPIKIESILADVSQAYYNTELGAAVTNHDNLKFHGFFDRVRTKFFPLWAENIDKLLRDNQLKKRKYISYLEIILSPSGHILTYNIIDSSGKKVADLAGANAFMDARHFPHPPKALIESDDFIHLKYKLILNLY